MLAAVASAAATRRMSQARSAQFWQRRPAEHGGAPSAGAFPSARYFRHQDCRAPTRRRFSQLTAPASKTADDDLLLLIGQPWQPLYAHGRQGTRSLADAGSTRDFRLRPQQSRRPDAFLHSPMASRLLLSQGTGKYFAIIGSPPRADGGLAFLFRLRRRLRSHARWASASRRSF